MTFDKDLFFDQFRPYYKKKTGKKTLSVQVANAVDFLLDQFSSYAQWSDVRQIAYAMATIAHETAWTFQPIKEYRAKAGTKARANQDRYWLSGYYGRGYVQLTWLKNYKLATKKLGVDLVGNPSLALSPEIAFQVLTYGMQEGWFTTKKLSDYINPREKNYLEARRIINGTDKASTIAGYARDFEVMLKGAIVIEDSTPLIKRTGSVEAVSNDTETYTEAPQEFDAEGNPVDVSTETPTEHSVAEEPIDNYPESPKPGEAAPEQPAQEGEAVVGGRPGDPPKIVESAEPKETSGWGTWTANIRAQIAALGIGGVSVGSIWSGLVTNPTLINYLILLVVVVAAGAALIFTTSIIIKAVDKRAREKEAHEINMKQLEINSDPTKYNVKLVG